MSKEETLKYQGDLCSFLCDYACELIGAGGSGLRASKNVGRMAARFGCSCSLDISKSAVSIQLTSAENKLCAFRSKLIEHNSISFSKIRLLSSLSWDVTDKMLNLDQAFTRFYAITKEKPLNGQLVRILTCCANASFCELFGGDWLSMGVVFVATYVGFFIKQMLLKKKVNTFVTFAISAFIAALISSTTYIFHIGNTPDVAFGTSVLYLVPGIPYLNSVCDFFSGHIKLGTERIIDAILLTASLSLGFCGAAVIMKIF